MPAMTITTAPYSYDLVFSVILHKVTVFSLSHSSELYRVFNRSILFRIFQVVKHSGLTIHPRISTLRFNNDFKLQFMFY